LSIFEDCVFLNQLCVGKAAAAAAFGSLALSTWNCDPTVCHVDSSMSIHICAELLAHILLWVVFVVNQTFV
jgi:hypothetical protein